jgi:hypothetical protein
MHTRLVLLALAVVAVAIAFPSHLLASRGDAFWVGPTTGTADWDDSTNWNFPEGEGVGAPGIPDEGNEKAFVESTLTGDRDIRWKGFGFEKGPLEFRWTANGTAVDKITLEEDMYLMPSGMPPVWWVNTSGDSSKMVLDLNGFSATNLPAQMLVPGMTFTDSSVGQTGALDFPMGFRLAGGNGTPITDGPGPSDIVFDPSIEIRSGPGNNSQIQLYGHTLPNLTFYHDPDRPGFRHQWQKPGDSGSGAIDNLTMEGPGYLQVLGGGPKQINGDLVFPLDPSGHTGLTGGSIHATLMIKGDLIDPNTTWTEFGSVYDQGQLNFNGGDPNGDSPVQTVEIHQSDLGFRLQVGDYSHLRLGSDYHSTNPLGEYPGSGINSRIGIGSKLDVGSHTFTTVDLANLGGHDNAAPTFIYGDGGAINVTQALINLMDFNVEITDLSSHTSGDDFILFTYADSSVIGSGTNIMSPNLLSAVLPAGWTHGGMEYDGMTGGTIRLVDVIGESLPNNEFTWNATDGGSWNTSTSWSPSGVPDSQDHTMTFDSSIAGGAVTVDSPVVANKITFDNGSDSFTVAGPEGISLQSSTALVDPSLSVASGSHTISAAVTQVDGTTVGVAGGASLTLGAVDLGGGTLTKEGDGELRIDGTAAGSTGTLLANAGTVSGSGTVGGDLINLVATVAPGSSPGILTVDGVYTQGENGTLAIEIGGTTPGDDHDRLVVTGQAILAGTLDVSLIDGFTLGGSLGFDILDFSAVNGDFSTVNLPAGLTWDVSDGTLSFGGGSVGLAGDYNGNGTVDAADYVVWRDNLGAADESALNGNGDGTGGVDQADYLRWKNNFGSTLPGSGNSAAVPEPAALSLVVLTALAALVGCRGQRAIGTGLPGNRIMVTRRRGG